MDFPDLPNIPNIPSLPVPSEVADLLVQTQNAFRFPGSNPAMLLREFFNTRFTAISTTPNWFREKNNGKLWDSD
jgi:hypothetical protein